MACSGSLLLIASGLSYSTSLSLIFVIKYPDEKQHRGTGAYFSTQFEVSVHRLEKSRGHIREQSHPLFLLPYPCWSFGGLILCRSCVSPCVSWPCRVWEHVLQQSSEPLAPTVFLPRLSQWPLSFRRLGCDTAVPLSAQHSAVSLSLHFLWLLLWSVILCLT